MCTVWNTPKETSWILRNHDKFQINTLRHHLYEISSHICPSRRGFSQTHPLHMRIIDDDCPMTVGSHLDLECFWRNPTWNAPHGKQHVASHWNPTLLYPRQQSQCKSILQMDLSTYTWLHPRALESHTLTHVKTKLVIYDREKYSRNKLYTYKSMA